ncbi:MAG: cytochrome c biogenesis protein CcsA, partial [Planctomycetes bacterium]|nr:cytochrome c biogenesis protein CcsA [Planctomycetota bacterium]
GITKKDEAMLTSILWGVLAFGLFFSFTGTVLGGIWADQSWGRFWGWDPKENGALLVVAWIAIIMHARFTGWIRLRGMMVMAVIGNMITAFAWFGVNMMGVGMHAYAFMDGGLKWLLIFVASQAVLACLAFIPAREKVDAKPDPDAAPSSPTS